MYILSDIEEVLCSEIRDCAFRVHRELGPGLLEKVYEACFCHEPTKKEIPFVRQVKLPIHDDGLIFDEGLQLDVLVDNKVIYELKAIEIVNPIWQAQILSHLKLTKVHVGYIINFNSILMKDGIRRYCVQ